MWLSFFTACLFVIGALYLPGTIVTASFTNNLLHAICFAPAVGIFLYSVIELVYCALGIPCSAISVGIAAAAICFACFLASKTIKHRLRKHHAIKGVGNTPNDKRDYALFLLYIAVGIAAVGLFYIKQLDGPESFFQGWDNVHHLPAIQTYAQSGVWNPLFSSSYAPSEVTPYVSSTYAFYPSAWHILCASVMSALGVSAPLSINCVNAVLIGIIFPSSMYSALRVISNNDRLVVIFGSLLASGIPACPWDYVIYGPLYPNLLSMVLVPIVMAEFITALKSISDRNDMQATSYGMLTILSAAAVALAHPNGIFTLIVFLAPYLTYWLFQELGGRKVRNSARAAAIIGLWIAIIGFWIVCYHHPAFSEIVNTTWASISSTAQSIVDALLLSVVNHPAQIAVFFLLIPGVLYLLTHQTCRWIIATYIACSSMYILDAGTDSQIKNWLTGFWYTDYHRTGAMLGLIAIVVASFGAAGLIRAFIRLTAMNQHDSESSPLKRELAPGILYLILGIGIYIGSFTLKGIDGIQTPFGYQAQEFAYQNNYELIYYDILTVEEQEFAKRALSLIPDDATIINNPNDGSLFLYPLYGTRLYYRNCFAPDISSESTSSQNIRLHLSSVATSNEVQVAIRDVGALYVLQLDAGERQDEFRINYQIYEPSDWAGINNIDDDTPGFTVIYKEKDMCLYRIDIDE